MSRDFETPVAGEAATPARGWGLYVHVPFCATVCPYCDFARTTARDPRVVDAFVAAVPAELDALLARRPELAAVRYDTIYLGGGTPSLLDGGQLTRLLAGLRDRLETSGAWLGLEANPEDVGAQRIDGWRHAGVNMVSVGVQSLDAGELRALGRRHDAAAARGALALAVASGFACVSADLMYGLPGQDLRRWRQTVEEVLAIAPDHLSCYQLTVKSDTPYARRAARGQLRELDAGRQAEFFEETHALLPARGWAAYEVSSFARGRDLHSPHNRKYWEQVPVIGLGPGAHSFDGERRWWNGGDVRGYLAAVERGDSAVAGEEALGREELALEALLLGLRTVAGVDLERLSRRWGARPSAAAQRRIAAWIEQGLLLREGEHLRPTAVGLAVADGLARDLDLEFGEPRAPGGGGTTDTTARDGWREHLPRA